MYKKNIKSWFSALLLAVSIGGSLLALSPVTSSVASADVDCSGKGILTFPAWYRGLAKANDTNDGCDIVPPGSGDTGISTFIWSIVLNCLDILLQVVLYISTFFILYGGFLFISSSGEAAGIAKAKTTITNAVIGLIISLVAVGVVNFIFGILN